MSLLLVPNRRRALYAPSAIKQFLSLYSTLSIIAKKRDPKRSLFANNQSSLPLKIGHLEDRNHIRQNGHQDGK